MLGYKMDKLHITIIITYIVFLITLLYFPYRIDIDTQEVIWGYKSFLHWVLMVYCLRLSLHAFGWEIFNFKAHIIAISVILVFSSYLKFLFGNRESAMLNYEGLIMPIIMTAIMLGVLYLDRYFYVLERK